MSVPSLAEVVRQLSSLSDVRGDAGAGELRWAIPILDRLSPSELAALLPRPGAAYPPAVPGLSAAANLKLHAIASAGPESVLAQARAGLPWLIRRLLELSVVTCDQAAALARDLGVATLPDLQGAIRDGRTGRLGTVAADALAVAAPQLARELRPLTLGRAHEALTAVLDIMRTVTPACEEAVIAGDARRFEPLVTIPVIVARAGMPDVALDALSASPGVSDVLHRSGRRALLLFQHAEIDVHVGGPDDYGTILFNRTGPREHVRAVTGRLRRPVLCSREKDVYTQAGLPWIPPELRQGAGEVEAGAAGRLPLLLERRDIRGDLHMHSTYSDGRDTVETMVSAAAALGYEYLAITDHSQSAAAQRTMSADQLKRQGQEIERLRERFPTMSLLHGVEVDILPDGRLDFDDDLLAGLDIVLASLHDPARQDGPTLTRRYLRAIRHPLVNVITHPANQLVGRRPGYALDYDALYEAAAETGTALEIDGAPSHLDLDGEHARAAVAAGVTVTVDSDCHRAGALGRQMDFGVGTARRGWVEARHVLNARPLAEVRAFVKAKRRAAGGPVAR